MTIPEHPRRWPATEELSADEIARQQGIKLVWSIEDLEALGQPGAFGSDEEHAAFLADLYASRRSDI